MNSSELDALARTGRLDDRRLVPYLHGLDYSELLGLLGQPSTRTEVAAPLKPTWNQGDPRPGLADEDPAVMCAIARCACARFRSDGTFGRYVAATHPEACGWCEYPALELIRALDWSTWWSQFVTDEAVVWRRDGAEYRRPTDRVGTYANPRWMTFARLTEDERRYRVDAAMVASRAMLDPIPGTSAAPGAQEPATAVLGAAGATSHDPWCDLPADHAGDCPNPKEEPDD